MFLTTTSSPPIPLNEIGIAQADASNMAIDRKYMFAVECSKPQVMKALIGKTIAPRGHSMFRSLASHPSLRLSPVFHVISCLRT